ncbi:MAG: hypothetical protein IJI98_01935 [Methanosphaera sp.]|nr:hypothetical protein [Methanosphaera sp.]
MKYNIPLRVKLSNKEYDKVKKAKNKSKFVRDAINYYDGQHQRENELSKKEMLKKIMKNVEEEEKRSAAKINKTEKLKRKRIMNKLTKMSDKCDEELSRLAKENSSSEESTPEITDPEIIEEKILSVLPTLQGIHNSDIGTDYDTIHRVAVKLKIDTTYLKEWMDSHHELLNKRDYLTREHIHQRKTRKKHDFKYDI